MDDFDSPYCEKCNACGEDGCCSYLNCFSALVEDNKCDYGRIYLKAAKLDKGVVDLSFDIFEKLKNKEISSEQAVEEFDKGWHVIYDKIYRNNEKIDKEK